MTRNKKTPASSEETALARVRMICLALPDTHEKEAWGAPTFRVGGRLFAMFVDNHHADGRLAVWCNAPPVAQEALVAARPEHFFVPPYVGPQGWVGVRLDTGLGWDVVAQRLEAAHGVSAAKGKVSARPRRAGAAARRGARRRDT